MTLNSDGAGLVNLFDTINALHSANRAEQHSARWHIL